MYGTYEPRSLYDMEAFIYVQEAQLDNFWQELDVSSISANIAHGNQQTCGVRDNTSSNRGRVHKSYGRGCASPGTKPTCQLWCIYGHDVVDCWHMFDEHFTPTLT